ncbi:MAG: hypothetical protein ACRDP8_11595 [Actinopolymorphaceae bacterium]
MNPPLESTRECTSCGQPFTISTKNPRRRFCSPRCRAADWHARNRTAADADADANDVHPTTNAVPNGEPRPNGVQTANGVQRCPHCHHELAVIAVLVPPAAANVRLPEVTMTSPT